MTGSNKNEPDRSDGSWTNKQTKKYRQDLF